MKETRVNRITNDEKADIIIDLVCLFYKTDMRTLKTRCRKTEYTEPRHVIMYCLRKYTSYRIREIASFFHKDHSTASHAFNNIENLLKYNGYSRKLEPLFDMIESKLWIKLDMGFADHIGTMISNYHELQVR